jgi:transposase
VAREHVAVPRDAVVTRLNPMLDVVSPEFERIFRIIDKKTPQALPKAYPGLVALLKAKKTAVLRALKTSSRNHLGVDRYEELIDAAKKTLALPGAQVAHCLQIPLIVARIELFTSKLEELKARMIAVLGDTPEAEFLLTIPGVNAVTEATFLGSIGDPSAHESSALGAEGRRTVARRALLGAAEGRGANLQAQSADAASARVHVRAQRREPRRHVSRGVRKAPR